MNQNPTPPTLAVFDFDHTLIEGDSFWPFLCFAAGKPRVLQALAAALALYGWHRLCAKARARTDARSFVKTQLVDRLLAGRATASLAPAIGRLQKWRRWNEQVRQKLHDHHAQGHRILIISGALDLYLPALAAELPHDALICTTIETSDGTILSGLPHGNCVRARKAELLKEWLAANGPFADTWGYGNLPHDLPMLEMLHKRIVV